MKRVLMKKIRPDLSEAYLNEWIMVDDTPIIEKSAKSTIESLRKEYAEIVRDFKNLVVKILQDNKTNPQTREYLIINPTVKKLMGDTLEYYQLCKSFKRIELIEENGAWFDSHYQ